MSMNELITQRANELAAMLDTSLSKSSVDADSIVKSLTGAHERLTPYLDQGKKLLSPYYNSARQVLNDNVNEQGQVALRNAAIGAGVGGVYGLASSRSGYRTGDALRSALAGGLIGGGGTAAVQAMSGRLPGPAVSSADKPMDIRGRTGADAAAAAATTGASKPDGMINNAVGFVADRPVTSATLGAAGGLEAMKQVHDRYGNGNPLDNVVTSPFKSNFLPHVPGEKSNWLVRKLKGVLGSNDSHNSSVANKLRANLDSWRKSLSDKGLESQSNALGLLDGNLGDDELNELAKVLRGRQDFSAAGNAGPRNSFLDDLFARKNDAPDLNLDRWYAQKMPSGITGANADAVKAIAPGQLRKYLAGRAPWTSRNRIIGGLATGAAGLLEPTLWGLGESVMNGGDPSKVKVTPEQERALSAKYFNR